MVLGMGTVSGQTRAKPTVWKVGELARRTGLSVRTLRYYDEIGLLSPSRRTESGHRLYAADDVVRLQQIRSLRTLGFGLEEIRNCLRRPSFSARRVVELHLSRLEERIRAQQRLRDLLRIVAARLDPAEEVSAGEFMEMATEVIEMSEKIEKYYTPEQLEQLEERRRELGEERIKEVEAEWPRLMQEIRTEMDAGTDPAEVRVQLLARRWMGLVHEFTGGDSGIHRSLHDMWQQEENLYGVDTGDTRAMGEYISRALAASEEGEE